MKNRKTTSTLRFQITPGRELYEEHQFRMYVTVAILGILSLFFSSYGIRTFFEKVQIDLPWSIILPLFAALVYGARGGFWAGLIGGIWFPFLLWPDNGWSNLLTAVLFLIIYTVTGFAAEYGDARNKRVRSLLVATLFNSLLLFVGFIFLFNPLLSVNPPPWETNTILSLPQSLVYSFVIKDSINVLLFTFSAESLLHFPPLRTLFNLPNARLYRKNSMIFMYVAVVVCCTWSIYFLLALVLIPELAVATTYHFQIILLITIPGGLLTAGAICRYVEQMLLMQEEIYGSEKKFRSYIESSPNAVFVTDMEGKFLEVNKAACEMTGYNEQELYTLSFLDLIDSVSQMTALEQIRSLLTGERLNKEYAFTTKDGKHRWWTANTVRLAEKRCLIFAVDITAIKLAERSIAFSEARLKQAEQFAKLGHFEIDLKTGIVAASPETFNILSIPAEKQQAYSIREFVSFLHTDERESLIGKFLDAFRNKTSIDFIYRIILPHDTEKYIHTFATFRMDETSGHQRLFGIFQDVTDYRLAELNLQERENRFRIINEMVSDWASQYKLNDDGTMTREWILGTVDKFTGTSLDEREKIGGWHAMVHPDDLELLKDKNFEAIQTGTEQSFEYRAYHKDGSVIYLYNKVKPLFDPMTGKPSHLIIAGRNITEAKEAELARKQSETNFRSIFEMAPFCLIVSDTAEGRIVLANRYAYDFYETTPDEVTTAKEFYLDYSDRQRMVEELRKQGVIENFELKIKTKTGKIKWISMSARLIELNKKPYLLSVQVDIGPQKLAFDQMSDAKKRAEEASQMKSSFLANMSHELRTPLIGILGYSEIIAGLSEDSEITRMVNTIFSSGERLKNTLNLILDLSKLEANQVEVKAVQMELDKEFLSAVKLFEGAALKKGLYLKSDFPEGSLHTKLDLRLIHDIANNLLNNAIKFTQVGGITITGGKTTMNNAPAVYIQVSDTGIGIDKKDLNVIFEDFRQASEGLSRSFEGTGLGLALTKRYVLMMGGRISVSSTVGTGTTFTLVFPLIQPEFV